MHAPIVRIAICLIAFVSTILVMSYLRYPFSSARARAWRIAQESRQALARSNNTGALRARAQEKFQIPEAPSNTADVAGVQFLARQIGKSLNRSPPGTSLLATRRILGPNS